MSLFNDYFSPFQKVKLCIKTLNFVNLENLENLENLYMQKSDTETIENDVDVNLQKLNLNIQKSKIHTDDVLKQEFILEILEELREFDNKNYTNLFKNVNYTNLYNFLIKL